MSCGDGNLGILQEAPLRIAQNADQNLTIYAYDVQLDENGVEISRERMDLTGATIVFQVEDTAGVIEGVPDADFALSGTEVTLTDSTKTFTEKFLGKTVTISDATTPGNNGSFVITAVPTPTTIVYTNAAGASEAVGSASYEISDVVINKNSGLSSQIEIQDQLDELTKGTAILKLVGADTSLRTPGDVYWYDIWVHKASGSVNRIMKKSRFYIDAGVYEPSVGVPAAIPSSPALQSPQERSFKWTAPTTDDTFTIAIPGSGMVDATYIIAQPSFSTIPSGGSWTPVYCPEASRTPTQFVLQCNTPIAAGTILDFHLRDA